LHIVLFAKAVAEDAAFLGILSGDVAHPPRGPKPLSAAGWLADWRREPPPWLFLF
jgi:hypothetical protein